MGKFWKIARKILSVAVKVFAVLLLIVVLFISWRVWEIKKPQREYNAQVRAFQKENPVREAEKGEYPIQDTGLTVPKVSLGEMMFHWIDNNTVSYLPGWANKSQTCNTFQVMDLAKKSVREESCDVLSQYKQPINKDKSPLFCNYENAYSICPSCKVKTNPMDFRIGRGSFFSGPCDCEEGLCLKNKNGKGAVQIIKGNIRAYRASRDSCAVIVATKIPRQPLSQIKTIDLCTHSKAGE